MKVKVDRIELLGRMKQLLETKKQQYQNDLLDYRRRLREHVEDKIKTLQDSLAAWDEEAKEVPHDVKSLADYTMRERPLRDTHKLERLIALMMSSSEDVVSLTGQEAVELIGLE